MAEPRTDIYEVVDGNGNVVGQVRYPEGGSSYKNALANRNAGQPNYVYSPSNRNYSGTELYEPLFNEDDIKANTSFTLDKGNGKITIKAPDMALKNETFKKQVSDVANAISANYKINPDHRYALMNNSEETKTSEEWVEKIQNDVKDMAVSAASIERVKEEVKKRDGVDLSDEDAVKMNSVALEYNDKDGKTVKVTDSTMQALPEKVKNLNVFKGLKGWDPDSHMVSWGNLKEEWSREKHSDEDILEVFKVVEEYFKNGDFSNPSEYAEMTALAQFIKGKDPDVSFWRNAAETVGETILGVITGAASFDVGLFSFLETMGNKFRDILDSAAGYNPAVDTKHEYFVRDYLAPVLEEWVSNRRSTTEKLSDARAGWGNFTDTITPISMELVVSVAAGKYVSAKSVSGINSLISNILARYSSSAVESISNTAQILGMTGKAVEFAEVVNGAEAIAESLYIGTELSLKLMSTAAAVETMNAAFNFINSASKVGKFVAHSADILAQAVVDITLTDPKLFRTLMESSDTKSKEYALRQLSQNVAGEVTGVMIGKGLMKFGESDLGLVLQAKSAPRVSKMKAYVGDAAEKLKARLHGGNMDWLKDKTDELRELADNTTSGPLAQFRYNRAGKYERKLQNLNERRILRAANAKVGELAGYVHDADNWEDALNRAREVKGKMADTLAKANNLINKTYNRDVTAIVARFYIDNPELSGARDAYVEKLSKVIKAENAAGMGSKSRRTIELSQEVGKSGKELGKVKQVTFGIINPETNEYILGQYRIERAKAIVENSKVVDDVRGAKKEIEYYTELVENFRRDKPAELVAAADDLLAEGRKFSGLTQELRVKEGVLSEEQLTRWRESGFFDEGYMRTQKAGDWERWRKEGGQLKISDPRGIDSYRWGKTDEPFQDISLVLFDDVNEVARQVNRKNMVTMLKDLGFKVDTVVDGDKTRIVAEASKKSQKVAIQTVESNTRKLVSNNSDTGLFSRFFKKKGADWFVSKANAEASDAALNLARVKAKTNPKITKAYKVKYLEDAPIREVNGILADNGDTAFRYATRSDKNLWEFRKKLDPQSKKMLDQKMMEGVGRNYNIPYIAKEAKTEATNIARREGAVWSGKLAQAKLADSGEISSSDLKKLYTVSNFRNNTGIDQDFIDNIKRQYVYHKYGNTDDVVNTISAAKYREDLFRAETLYKDNLEKLAAIRKKYDIPDFNNNVQDDIEDIIEEAITANYDSAELKDVANALADGTAGLDDLVEYTTLQSLYKNRKDIQNKFYNTAVNRYNQILTENISKKYASESIESLREKYAGKENAAILKQKINEAREMVKLKKQKLADVPRMAESWANETSNMLETRIEERYAECTRRLMQQGSELVTEEAKRSVFDRIAELNKEISDSVKTDNVIKTYGAYGYEEYVEVSPTVADMFTSMPRPLKRGPFGTIQQQFVRIFRFGTTGGLVPGSLVSQGFRDTGGALAEGAAFKSDARVEAELAELFGDRFAEEYQKMVPDVYATLLKQSKETGEDINRLIARREMQLGEANINAQLEQNIYSFGREARLAKNARGNYDTTVWERITDNLDYYSNKAERVNNAREIGLRKRVYNNNLLSSLKQGLSVQQSRNIAEFLQSEATTNFTRQSYHFANLTKTVPYLGSAINGQKSFWRLLAWDPVGVSTRIIGGYVVPVIALTNMTLANEEDRRIYKQIPEYEKAENLVFVINGQIISIPIPQEISNFVVPVQHFIETLQGVNNHDFNDLLLNDLLGAFPVELDGFMNIDADQLLEQNIFERNLIPGVAKVSSTLMTPLEKAGFIIATGYDPYTMKKVSRDNVMLDYETGEMVPMNTQAGALAKAMGSLMDGFMSATMAEKVLRNLIGQGNVLIFDSVVNLASSIVDPNKNIIEHGFGEIGKSYLENALNRVQVNRYGEEVNLAWNRAVKQLWDEKRELLADKKYQDDIAALQGTNLSESARNEVLSRVRTRQQEFMDKVCKVANNLVEKYDGTFDRNKFAAVISLMNLESKEGSQLPSQSYSKYLTSQQKQINRAAAIETMARMGFRGPNDNSVFGYYAEDLNTGDIVVQYNSPINILNYQETTKWQDEIAFADIRNIINEENLYEAHDALRNQINAIYNNKKITNQDRANIEKLQIEWNYKVAQTIAPVLAKMTPYAAINNKKVKDLLYTYIEVPGSFEVNNKGRYVTLGDNGSKKAAYYDSWMSKLFGYKNKYAK